MSDEPRSGWKTGFNTWSVLKPAARQFRHAPTPAEAKLWQVLRAYRKGGFAFRRQHAIGSYLVAFYCARAGLVVEVDGAVHETQQAEDAHRTEFLETNRLRVLRFKNEEVLDDISFVLGAIEAAVNDSPSP